MRQNIFLNSVLNRGAILGFVMLCSHIFEQCAVVYGGTMTWFSIMGFEMVASYVVYVWLLYKFAKSYSAAVLEQRSELKMFSYGAGLSYVTSVSMLAGVIVGLGRYIIHSIVIGHDKYVQSMITSMQSILKANPQTASMMGSYGEVFNQMAAQPEPSVFATIISSVWSYLLAGTIVGLIVAAIVKHEPELFDEQNSEE
ncbi:MAG: DUF4199 domain-containing protein [Alistipes sp.]|nr:DUF4199 domain-containing protein [Alistipes sp.]